jgi:hypothetical protein
MPRGSRVIVYGGLSEEASSIPVGDLIFANKSVEGFWLTSWLRTRKLHEALRATVVVQRALRNEYKTVVRARLPLEAATDGLERYAREMTGGKVLFLPGH